MLPLSSKHQRKAPHSPRRKRCSTPRRAGSGVRACSVCPRTPWRWSPLAGRACLLGRATQVQDMGCCPCCPCCCPKRCQARERRWWMGRD